eukprot:4896842-Lingulodinium_polyedra.AAC.1
MLLALPDWSQEDINTVLWSRHRADNLVDESFWQHEAVLSAFDEGDQKLLEKYRSSKGSSSTYHHDLLGHTKALFATTSREPAHKKQK